MQEHNDELSKFIRNRLQSAMDANENWDKPDAVVWENAQAQLPLPQKEKKRVIPFWFYGLALTLFLLAALFYNWHASQLEKGMQKQLNEQIKIIAQLEKQVTADFEKQQSQVAKNALAVEKLQLTNSTLVQENEQLNKECQQIQQQYQTLLSVPSDLKNVLKLAESNESNSINKSLAKASKTPEINPQEETEALPYLAINPIVAAALDLPEVRFSTMIKKKPRGRFELGVNYGFSMLRLPSTIEFKEDKKTLKETNKVAAPMYQLHFGYSLNKNWWLKTGVHYAHYLYKNNFQFKTEYDKSKEFIKPNGTVANELEIETNTGYFRSSQGIQIDIPDDADLKTGDFVFGTFEEKQRIQLWQIPLGIVYRQQNRKLGWQIEGGILFNKMTFSDTAFKGTIQSTQNEFSTEIINKIEDSSTSKLLLGTQAGIGANYQLSQKWVLNTGVLFQFNPHFLNQNIRVGLSYQF